METNAATGTKELNLERLINAPREKVWQAWTNAEQLKQWWGPNGFTAPVCTLDLKPGGEIYIEMKGPDGKIYPMKGAYREIVKPEWMVFSAAALDENGNAVLEDLTMVALDGINNQTRLTVRAVVTKVQPEGLESLEGMEQGWNETLDRLQQFLDGNKKKP